MFKPGSGSTGRGESLLFHRAPVGPVKEQKLQVNAMAGPKEPNTPELRNIP